MSIKTIYQQYQNLVTSSNWQSTACVNNTVVASQKQNSFQHMMQVNHFDSNMIVSRIQGNGIGTYRNHIEEFSHNFSLFLMLSGQNTLTVANKQNITVSPNQIWLVKGDWHNVTEEISTTDNQLSAIHLDFSRDRLRRWQDDGVLSHQLFSPRTANHTCITKLTNNLTSIRPFANHVLSQPYTMGSLAQLELESATLSLCAKLLQLHSHDSPQPKHRKQINEAIDIIHAEYFSQLSIVSLAKRVGMNECHLKRYFKQQTDQTIAQYIRCLRLNHAHEMLVFQGKSIKETMFFVGYLHTSHFNDIFKRQFGITPKQAKQI